MLTVRMSGLHMIGLSLALRSYRSIGRRHEVRRDSRMEARNQAEALAPEQHIRRKSALPAKIILMRPPPRGECAIILAFVVSEGLTDLVKAPLRQLGRFDHRHRHTRAIQHHPLFADPGL